MVQPDLGPKYKEDPIDDSVSIISSLCTSPRFIIALCEIFPTSISFRSSRFFFIWDYMCGFSFALGCLSVSLALDIRMDYLRQHGRFRTDKPNGTTRHTLNMELNSICIHFGKLRRTA
jgi:hypothetical protein